MSDQDLRIPNHAGWPRCSIDELSELVSRGTAPAYVALSAILAIGQRCVTGTGFDEGFARPHDERRMHNVLVPRVGDVFINSTGRGTIGRSCVFKASGRFIVDGHITIVRPCRDVVDAHWIEALIRSPWGQNFLETQCYSGSTNQVELSRSRFVHTSVPLPPIKEQRKIAEILDTMDEAIRSTERLIAKLEQAKQSLLQAFLTRGIGETGHLRDPRLDSDEFEQTWQGSLPRGWVVEPLDRVLVGIDAGRSPDLPDRPARIGEWGVLKVSAIRASGLQENENKVVLKQSLIDPKIEVKHGDLLISRANTTELVGLACYVRNPRPGLMLSDKTLRLRFEPKLAVAEFVAYLLQSSSARRQIEMSGTGSSGSMKNISQNEIRSIVLPWPSVWEQRKILAQIGSFQACLEVAGQELVKFRTLKQGLMDDLLTGRVRVNVEEGGSG